MRLIMQAVPDAARRAVATQTKRLGFVATTQQAGNDVVSILVDGDTTPTTIINATGQPLTAGQRVVVDFYPPHGALVSGIIGPVAPAVVLATIAPTANRDVTSVTFVNWTTETVTVTAPAWATRAIITTHAHGWYDPTSNGLGIVMITQADGVDGNNAVLSLTPGFNGRGAASWVDEYPVSGSVLIRPRARRSSGTGTLRADTSTRFQYRIEWLP